MPVNEFEKQVQQKMDELQFRPSPAVWSEVERRIRKEKKRRILLFWLPLLGLLIGGGITILSITAGQHNDKTLTGQNTSVPASSEADKQNSSTNQPSTQSNTTTAQQSTNTPGAPVNNDAAANTNVTPNDITSTNKNQPVVTQQQQAGQQTPASNYRKPTLRDNDNASFSISNAGRNRQRKPAVTPKDEKAGKDQQSVADTRPVLTEDAAFDKVTITKKETETSTTPVTPDIPVVTPAATDSQAIVKTEEPVAPVQEKTEEASQPIKIKNTRKWKWGVEVNTGLSNARAGELLGLGSTEKRAEQFYNLAPGATASYGPLIGSPISVSAPTIGHSFGAEVYAQKDISKKLSIQLGLRFSQMTTRQKVGRHFDNPVRITNGLGAVVDASGYYSASPGSLPTGTSDYTNRYNYVGLSGMLAWKVIDRKKFTLNWENGLVVNQLVASNALHFNSVLRGYYKDFSMFRKTQFMLSTAVSVPVWRSRNTTLLVRPFGSYGLSPLLKESTSSPVYMINYGLGLRLLFGNKK